MCTLILEELRRKELVSFDAPWSVWALHIALVRKTQAVVKLEVVKLEVVKRRTTHGRKKVQGQTWLLKLGREFVLPSMDERTGRQKPGIGDVLMFLKMSLEQEKTLMRELEQENVSNIEVDPAEEEVNKRHESAR